MARLEGLHQGTPCDRNGDPIDSGPPVDRIGDTVERVPLLRESADAGIDKYLLVFYAWWADYEEDGWVIISEKSCQYFCQEGGHSVMDKTVHHDERWQPEPISQEEALQMMLEWEEHEDRNATTTKEAMERMTE